MAVLLHSLSNIIKGMAKGNDWALDPRGNSAAKSKNPAPKAGKSKKQETKE